MHGHMYRRVHPSLIKERVEPHRYISYIHHLDTDCWTTLDEYLEKVRLVEEGDHSRRLWTEERRDEALRALSWLTQKGYAEAKI